MDGEGPVNRHKIDMWQRSALHSRLNAACVHDRPTEKRLLDVAAQYDDLIDQETGALLRAKTRTGSAPRKTLWRFGDVARLVSASRHTGTFPTFCTFIR
jgi:hypothetical protein